MTSLKTFQVPERISQTALVGRIAALDDGVTRRVVAIVGAPGSGKSTLAEGLEQALNASEPGRATVLPMDGFHYDDAVLRQMNRLPWKGAPDTFDVGGFRSALMRLRAADENPVAVPVFDRALEISRGSARLIPPEARLILAEGNYLLLDEAPWSQLAGMFDLTVMIDVPEDELRRRLTQRWVHFGLDDAAIAHKLDGNDLPNGRRMRDHSRPADLTIVQGEG
ncbi:nucleoside triphosphate hydrolase [Meridianimarinicoccus aquatilis]|uniref:Nucleoside triphosphate hydrolase n=1 Tax=Meridianimarinicoccus aquatilis TaxID=2552766 RepID=A0A4V3BCC7_9RHOB|nr:nucleoside triphosphate hydrolase [Fluviibacterium aquatile]TDL90419.1 nucleoside triphosphate hydrolase [Fluviibacterium aquatile]